jgi:hypothetical protein
MGLQTSVKLVFGVAVVISIKGATFMTVTTMHANEIPVLQRPSIFEQPSIFEDAWLRLLISRDHGPNILVQSTEISVAAATAELNGLCSYPLEVCLVPGNLRLPARRSSPFGTFIIGDVSRLTLQQQINLSDWMTYRNRGTRVVSITSVPLLPLTQDGRFLEDLYYRLNMVYVLAARAGVRSE